MKRKWIVLLVAFAALVFLAGLASAQQGPPPQTPEQARANFLSAPGQSKGGQGRPVSRHEAMTKPFPDGSMGKAETGPPPKGSPAARQGVVGPFRASNAQRVAWEACWYAEPWQSRGVFPYWRKHIAATYWCAEYGNYITYRRTNQRPDVNGVCSHTGHSHWRTSGGIGYSWVKIHAWMSFSCPTPYPWFELNDTLWMNPAFNVWGNYAIEESNT